MTIEIICKCGASFKACSPIHDTDLHVIAQLFIKQHPACCVIKNEL
jgi:hypothetical protein